MIIHYLSGPDAKLPQDKVRAALLTVVDGLCLPKCKLRQDDPNPIINIGSGDMEHLSDTQFTTYSIASGGPWTLVVCDGVDTSIDAVDEGLATYMGLLIRDGVRSKYRSDMLKADVYDEDAEPEDHPLTTFNIAVLPFETGNAWQA